MSNRLASKVHHRFFRNLTFGVLFAFAPLRGVAYSQEVFELPRQAKQTEGKVRLSDGEELWYWDTGGDGPAVVFMHAGSMSGKCWAYQQPAFAAAGFRVIGYSRRSYSGSSSSVNPGIASEDLSELFEQLNVKNAHLIASAHGGSFAVDFALSYPEKLTSLTLVASLLGIDETDYNEMLNRILPPFFGSLPTDFKELSPTYRAENPKGVEQWNKLARIARDSRYYRSPRRANTVNWKSVSSIETSVLILGGEADLYAPPPLLEMQAEHFPNAKLKFIPRAGHSPYWETPDEFNKVLIEFIRDLKK